MTDAEFLAFHGLAVDGEADGRVIGAGGIYMVSAEGHQWLDESCPTVFAGARDDVALVTAYERFEKVNTELLALLIDWRTTLTAGSRIPNDHADAEAQPRLGHYYERLASANDRILVGERDASGVTFDSCHAVWFELHEDLLRMLGMTRQE